LSIPCYATFAAAYQLNANPLQRTSGLRYSISSPRPSFAILLFLRQALPPQITATPFHCRAVLLFAFPSQLSSFNASLFRRIAKHGKSVRLRSFASQILAAPWHRSASQIYAILFRC